MNKQIKLIFLTIIMFWVAPSVFSHNLSGRITDQEGNPIPYATIYIKNLALGTTTNEDGRFEIELEPGTYDVNFRCLGFKPKTETITISKNSEFISVVLEVQILEIQEVVITGRGEDPAYGIMRKVIGLSYVHLNQISSYTADVYIRGTVRFQNIPGIIRNQLKRNNIDVKSGDVLVNETVSEISFKAPKTYTQRIKSVNSTFPEVVDFRVDDFLGASLYQDNIEILFTPLHKNAFSYYNFTYEGYTKEGSYLIDKIKVTPKRKSKQLFEGYIYIIEDLWCLHRADLKFDTPFGEVGLKLVYDEVHPGVWLPVGHNYNFSGGMMGVKASANFVASMKYNKIKINEQVLAMASLPGKPDALNAGKEVKKVEKKSSIKRSLKIKELLDKPQLKNYEVDKLTRLMTKEDITNRPDSMKSLEIKDNVKVSTEKGADKKDSTYWNEVRPIPLSEGEIESFRERDSIRERKTKEIAEPERAFNWDYGIFDPLFFGKRFYVRDSTWQVIYNGLLTIKNLNYKAVDGWNVSQSISFERFYKPGHSLTFTPSVAYAFSRKTLLGTLSTKYIYAPLNRGLLEFSFGKSTVDFNGAKDGINPFINSIASLFFKKNFARYYESRFIDLTNGIDVANGLRLTGNIKFEEALQLENTTDFSFLYKNAGYSPNIPLNREVTARDIADQRNAIAGVKVEYTPRYYYRLRDGVKIMSHSNFPTFYLQYEKGIKGIFSSSSDYDFIGGGMLYAKELSSTSSIAYEAHAGWFPNNNQIHFSRFAHAPTQESQILLKEYRHAFFMPGYYELSTSDKFIRGHLSYKTPYLILKYLPLLSNTLWREMIWTSYYHSPQYRNYIEVGYTLLEVLLTANVGIFAGFEDGNFKGWGLNVAFRWTE